MAEEKGEEKERQPCSVPGCGGTSADDDGYCHGHRADRDRFIRQTIERQRKEAETPWDKMKRTGRIDRL
jgi:hypothetical protein